MTLADVGLAPGQLGGSKEPAWEWAVSSGQVPGRREHSCSKLSGRSCIDTSHSAFPGFCSAQSNWRTAHQGAAPPAAQHRPCTGCTSPSRVNPCTFRRLHPGGPQGAGGSRDLVRPAAILGRRRVPGWRRRRDLLRGRERPLGGQSERIQRRRRQQQQRIDGSHAGGDGAGAGGCWRGWGGERAVDHGLFACGAGAQQGQEDGR
jgi:hypothetical protein